MRSISVSAEAGVERLTVVCLAPQQFRFHVIYTPGSARLISEWARQTQAQVVINGGYFTEELLTTGLIVSQGQHYGSGYGDFAGMFAVTDEMVSLRWLREWPYDPNEALQEAVQSFPVLVKPGGVMGFPADADDGRIARRSVIAKDQDTQDEFDRPDHPVTRSASPFRFTLSFPMTKHHGNGIRPFYRDFQGRLHRPEQNILPGCARPEGMVP